MRWKCCFLVMCSSVCAVVLHAANPMELAMEEAMKKAGGAAASAVKKDDKPAEATKDTEPAKQAATEKVSSPVAAIAKQDTDNKISASKPAIPQPVTPQKDTEPKKSVNPMEAAAKKNTDAKEDHSNESDEDKTTIVDDSKISKPTLEVEDVYSSGLDTIHIDSGGNWLEKRIWFKKGEQLFDDIRNEVKKLADIRMEFVHEVNGVAKQIDEFYENVNLEKGQIDQLLKDVLDEVSQASFKRGGDLSSKERSLKLSIQNEQKQISQVSNDIKKIDDFDNQIDKTMQQAFKVIDACRSYESKAWDDFKEIGTELDDKKARILYYQMENAQKNIEQNIKYLESTLLPYLKNKLVGPGVQTMNNIKNTLKTLDEKGINLEKMIKGDVKADEETIKKREEEKEHEVEEKWEQKRKEQEEQEKKSKELAVQKAKEEAEEKREQVWYNRMFREACCAMKSAVQWACCLFISLGQKIADLSPSTTQEVKETAGSVYAKLMSLPITLHGYLKQIICSIKDFICHLLGY